MPTTNLYKSLWVEICQKFEDEVYPKSFSQSGVLQNRPILFINHHFGQKDILTNFNP
jgi:hypothetical protein